MGADAVALDFAGVGDAVCRVGAVAVLPPEILVPELGDLLGVVLPKGVVLAGVRLPHPEMRTVAPSRATVVH